MLVQMQLVTETSPENLVKQGKNPPNHFTKIQLGEMIVIQTDVGWLFIP